MHTHLSKTTWASQDCSYERITYCVRCRWTSPHTSATVTPGEVDPAAQHGGRDWLVEEAPQAPKRRKPKGHKHDKLKLLRLADIETKLEGMPAKVAEYRVRTKASHGAGPGSGCRVKL